MGSQSWRLECRTCGLIRWTRWMIDAFKKNSAVVRRRWTDETNEEDYESERKERHYDREGVNQCKPHWCMSATAHPFFTIAHSRQCYCISSLLKVKTISRKLDILVFFNSDNLKNGKVNIAHFEELKLCKIGNLYIWKLEHLQFHISKFWNLAT